MSLLDRLREALGETPGRQPDPERAQCIAAAVLLLAMAHADFQDENVELTVIRRQLQAHFDLAADEAEELLATARLQARASVSLHPWLQTLNGAMAVEDKRRVLEMLWRVAYADEHLDPLEEHLMRELADLLHLPHADFIRAKLAVMTSADDSCGD